MSGPTGLVEILAITSPIFIIVALGYAAARFNIVPREGIRAMGGFLLNFAAPALLFQSVSSRSLAEVLHTDFLLAYTGGSLAALILALLISRNILKNPLTGSAIFGLGSSLSNSLMIGYPIVSVIWGPAALVPFALVLLVENFIVLPVALVISDLGRHRDHSVFQALAGVLPRLFVNPLILGILAGVSFSLLGFKLPAAFDQTIELLGRTVTGLGLFIIGGMLFGFRFSGKMRNISTVIAGKLVLHPLMVMFAMLLVPGVGAEMQGAGVVFAAVPMFGLFAVIGQRYELGPICSAILVLTTVSSFFTITVWLWMLGRFSPF